MSIAIGIDLGTSNSCVAVYTKDRVEVIANDEGYRITPSYVSFAEEGPIVGNMAKTHENPSHGIFDAKRFIGRKYSEIEEIIKNYPFSIVKGEGDSIAFRITNNNGEFTKKPEEISALVLKKLKVAASDRLGDDFKNEAVITVPAHFNMEQRKATQKAAEMAGLKVLRLLNEPTAAAIAYVFNEDMKAKKTVAVYDFGGGTFDVSAIEVDGKKITVKAIGGHSSLGGKDFDDRLISKCLEEIERDYGIGVDALNRRALRRIRKACEETKKCLSTHVKGKIVLECVVPDREAVSIQVDRSEFEETNSDLIQNSVDILKACLRDAGFDRTKIDEVVLVGGSSRIPKIQSLLKDYFGEKISKKINMEEAVASGAAIQASLLKENPHKAIEDISLTEILSLSLGTDTDGDEMNFILKKREALPAENTKRYKTIVDGQTFMEINILEGEDPVASKNNNLGKIVVDGLTPRPKGEVKVEVTFTVNLSGILRVTARETAAGITKQVTISLDKK